MPCSVCRRSGHNKRTCVQAKVEAAIRGKVRDDMEEEIENQICDFLCDELETEALCTAIEMGSSVLIPGLGIAIRLGRMAWKIHKK